MKKRIISVILTLCMVISLVPALPVFALTEGIYTYTVSKGKATITDCDDSVSGDLVIPSTLGGYPVTRIGNSAFYYCTFISSITIPDSVTTICESAFSRCWGPTSIEIPDSVTSIGEGAFESFGSLTSVSIGNGVTSIGEGAFSCCYSLDSIEIPDSVTSIGDYAFSNCDSLVSIEIPDSVTTIGIGVFSGCTSLTSVKIPDSVTTIQSGVFSGCTSLTSVKIPDSVTSIGAYAFFCCSSLTSIEIPDSVTSIGDYAFSDCYSLDRIEIPDSVTTIGIGVFSGCTSLTSVKIPDSVTTIQSGVFSGCTSLTSVGIGNSVTLIGEEAFYGCESLKSIEIPNSVTTIAGRAFLDCDSLTSVDIGNNVITIGAWAFESCDSLTNVKMGNSLYTIGESAFSYCESLTSIEIPDSVTTIGEFAFEGCASLAYVEIGNSVTSIENYAFLDCYSLDSIEIPDSVTTIGIGVFSGCTSLTSVKIPDSVTTIESGMFSRCTSLTSVKIPDSVTTIKWSAFSDCTSLTGLSIGNGITSIGNIAFDGCESLTDVYYNGTEEQWKKISIGSSNTYLKNATIHFSGTATKYEPSTDIDVKVESNPEYMPSAINEVTINGKGTAYGRFKILNSDGTVAKNKKVFCSIDGGTKKTVSTDKYGYATIKIPQITKSRDYIVAFSGSGIQSSSGTLSVKVEPLHFRTGVESSIEKGVSVGVGLEVGGEIGSLEAKAGVGSIGGEGSAKNTLSFEQEFVDNKHKITISSKTNYSAAVNAKLGLFAEAKEKNSIGVSVSSAADGKGNISGIFGVGFEDDDFKISDSGDIKNLAKFMLSAFIGTQQGNVATAFIADALKAPINSYELGTVISLKGGAHLAAVELGKNNVKGGVTIGGIDGASIWTNNTTLMADNSIKYASGVTTSSGTDLINVNIGVKKDKASTGTDICKSFIKDNMSVSAERDADFNLKKISVSSKAVDESSVLIYKKTESDNESITYTDEAAERVAQSYDKLNNFTTGKKALFSKKQLNEVMNTFSNSKESGVFSRTKSTEEELALDLSAKFKLGVQLGGKIGVAGISSYEYEYENGIFENGTYYMQAQNDIGNEVDELAITFEDMLDVAKDSINNILDSLWETAKGLADQAIEFGQASVKKASTAVTGWAVSITKAVSSIGSVSILAVENEASLFSTSSLATTIGEPYIINVTDKNGNEVTDFSESPFTLTLSYTEEQLAEAGVTDLDGIAVVRWDEDKCTYVKLGGTLDTENSCMTLEILKPGQYILAVDNCPPAVTQFTVSDGGANPKITAVVSDMSGIEDFTFSIGEEELINDSNIEKYYDSTTGEFGYQTENLADGEYTAKIYATDTFGNEVEKELVFVVDTTTPTISDVSEIPETISGDVSVSAAIESESLSSVLLNVGITDIYGNTVKNTVDMVEADGVYTAELPDIPNGSEVEVWISAYTKSGNKAESERQQATVLREDEELPVYTGTSGAYTYQVINGEAVLVGCDLSAGGAVEIPSELGGYTVTKIGDWAFSWNENITGITIPESIVAIGDSAFEGCDNLTDVYYSGAEAQWNGINIGGGNEPLTNATIHYNSFASLDKDGYGIVFDRMNNEITIKSGEVISGAAVIVALYNDGKLVGIKTQPKDLLEGDNTFACPITDFSGADTVKIMVWEDSKSASPALKSCEIGIE